MDREQEEMIRQTLVGDVGTDVVEVATPIRSMFMLLGKHGWHEVDHDGWWPRRSRGGVTAVLIPQGGSVADLCAVFRRSPRFDLMGYAGSLTSSFGVGEIVHPGSVRLLGEHRVYQLREATGAADTKLVTVPNLLSSYNAASELGPTIVDMECGFAAAALERAGGPVPAAHLVVTDRWPDQPFYSCGAAMRARITAGRDTVVEALVAELAAAGLV